MSRRGVPVLPLPVPPPLRLLMLACATLFTVISGAGAANSPPSFTNIDTPIILSENTPVGTSITYLEARDSDDATVQFSVVGDALVLAAGPLLRIRTDSAYRASVLLNAKLDYLNASSYSVMYSLTDRTNTITRQVNIQVTPYNRPPTFVNAPYSVTVSDDLPVGSTVTTIKANDVNIGASGAVTYQFLTPQPNFALSEYNGVINLTQRLNYATQRFYRLEVVARNGLGLNCTATLTISVTSSQGQPPYFLNLPYSASVSESTSVGSSILQVSAIDVGLGPPVPLNYTILSGALDMFAVNSTTGQLFVRKPLNREDPEVLRRAGILEIVIQVQLTLPNSFGTYPTTSALVSITILDVNNQTPTFDRQHYNATVSDCATSGTLLAMETLITVTDMDQGSNGQFHMYLEKDGLPFDVFDVVPQYASNDATVFLRVKNASAINFDLVQSFTFNIVASEYLTAENRSSLAVVTVDVLNVVEASPVFAADQYTATIDENSRSWTYIITIVPVNAEEFVQLQYSLHGQFAHLFIVNNSGAVFVGGDANNTLALDRESTPTMHVVLVASDIRNHSAAALLSIVLRDINDNPPQFPRTQYLGYVLENNDRFTVPVTMVATDHDLAPNNLLRYSIIDGDLTSNFTMNSSTGELHLVAPLDYEAMPAGYGGRYNLTVMATDGTLNTTTTVTVMVQDVNDNAPIFQQIIYNATIYSNSTTGSLVANVVAVDLDATSPNNLINYYIEGGAKDKFIIDSHTGAVTVAPSAVLNPDLYGLSYTVKVIGVDGGSPPLSGSCHIWITVIDVDIKPPRFLPIVFSSGGLILASVAEDTPVGNIFYTFHVENPSGVDRLRYQWNNGTPAVGYDAKGQQVAVNQTFLMGLFAVNANNGSVSVHNALNSNFVQRVDIEVLVEDAVTFLNATATLVILINSPSFHANTPPVFLPIDNSSPQLTFQVTGSSWRPGDSIGRVSAVNRDNVTDPIAYFINYDSTASRAFEITDANRKTGIITLTPGNFPLSSGAVDLNVLAVSSVSLNSSTVLRVSAIDFVPSIGSGGNGISWNNVEWKVSIPENSSVGSLVFHVSASNNANGSVFYFIDAGDSGSKFRVDSLTGVINTAGALDRETSGEFRLTIVARNGPTVSSSTQNVTGHVTVTVTDVNDNPPRFDSPSYSATVSGDQAVGTSLLTVTASDADAAGSNSLVIYHVDRASGNGSRLFDVDPMSGLVSVAAALDAISGDVYLSVIAADCGNPSLSTSVAVRVTVDSHRPTITSPPANVTVFVDSSQPAGQFIVRMLATVTDGVIAFSLPQPVDQQSFTVNSQTGIITSTVALNPAVTYTPTVRVVNTNQPSYDARLMLRIVLRDPSLSRPIFDRSQYPSPYPLSAVEGQTGVQLAVFNATHAAAEICYYIAGGDTAYMNYFSLDKTTGSLVLIRSLDHTSTTLVNLVVMATDDCWSGYWEMDENRHVPADPANPSLVSVKITVISGVRFSAAGFYGAVDTNMQPGVVAFQFANHIVRSNNGPLSFDIQRPFVITDPSSKNFTELTVDPFQLGTTDGILRSNVYFRPSWKGHVFHFRVHVNDAGSSLAGSVANVTIYVIDAGQQLTVVCDGTPDKISSVREALAEFLSKQTASVVGVDLIQSHCGQPQDSSTTDVLIHAINGTTSELVDTSSLLSVLSQKFQDRPDEFRNQSIQQFLASSECQSPTTSASTSSLSSLERSLIIVLVVIGSILLVFIAVLSALFFLSCRKYKRKLKAANAIAATYGKMSIDNFMNLAVTEHHAANKRTENAPSLAIYESSNPIWLETQRHRDRDFGHFQRQTDTDTSSKNSSEENTASSSTTPSTAALDGSDSSKSQLIHPSHPPNGHTVTSNGGSGFQPNHHQSTAGQNGYLKQSSVDQGGGSGPGGASNFGNGSATGLSADRAGFTNRAFELSSTNV